MVFGWSQTVIRVALDPTQGYITNETRNGYRNYKAKLVPKYPAVVSTER